MSTGGAAVAAPHRLHNADALLGQCTMPLQHGKAEYSVKVNPGAGITSELHQKQRCEGELR